jgi:hypothetical protein
MVAGTNGEGISSIACGLKHVDAAAGDGLKVD